MLRKINEGRVESDEGFIVNIIGLEALRYEVAGQFIDIEWNYNPISKKTLIYIKNIKNWDKPFNKTIEEDEKQKIIENISKALKLMKGSFEFI